MGEGGMELTRRDTLAGLLTSNGHARQRLDRRALCGAQLWLLMPDCNRNQFATAEEIHEWLRQDTMRRTNQRVINRNPQAL
jgi:hypothetical protein